MEAPAWPQGLQACLGPGGGHGLGRERRDEQIEQDQQRKGGKEAGTRHPVLEQRSCSEKAARTQLYVFFKDEVCAHFIFLFVSVSGVSQYFVVL